MFIQCRVGVKFKVCVFKIGFVHGGQFGAGRLIKNVAKETLLLTYYEI